MDEVELAEKVLIGVFLFEVIGILLGTTIGSSLNNPSVTALSGFSASVQAKANALSNSFSYQLLTPLTGNGWFGVNAIANALIGFFNIAAKIVLFIINFFELLALGILIILDMLFIVLPAMMSTNLGFLGYVFELGYGLMLILIAIFAFRWIREVLMGAAMRVRA